MFAFAFLSATKHLFNWLCPTIGWSVGWLIRLVGRLVGWVTHSFDDSHVAPYWPTWPYFFICRAEIRDNIRRVDRTMVLTDQPMFVASSSVNYFDFYLSWLRSSALFATQGSTCFELTSCHFSLIGRP